MANDKNTPKRSDSDRAGYDHSQGHGGIARDQHQGYGQFPNHRSGTCRDHDGGWSSQVGMD